MKIRHLELCREYLASHEFESSGDEFTCRTGPDLDPNYWYVYEMFVKPGEMAVLVSEQTTGRVLSAHVLRQVKE